MKNPKSLRILPMVFALVKSHFLFAFGTQPQGNSQLWKTSKNQHEKQRSFFIGPSFSLTVGAVGKEYLTTSGIGFNFGKEYPIAKKLQIVPEFGYSHYFGKVNQGIKYIPIEEYYFQFGPRYSFNENIFVGVYWGAHVTYRHYVMNKSLSNTINDYTVQFGYKVIPKKKAFLSVSLCYNHFLADWAIMNYVSIRTQFYIH